VIVPSVFDTRVAPAVAAAVRAAAHRAGTDTSSKHDIGEG
jgi:hypothetical protein